MRFSGNYPRGTNGIEIDDAGNWPSVAACVEIDQDEPVYLTADQCNAAAAELQRLANAWRAKEAEGKVTK